MKVGLIGVGVVGTALKEWIRNQGHPLKTFDLEVTKSTVKSFLELMDSEVIFVCVPTPTDSRGEQCNKPLESVLKELDFHGFRGVVCHKSTVLPGTTKMLSLNFPFLRIVHYPEFLTEANATKDFENQKAVLLSGDPDDTTVVARLFDCFTIREFTEYAYTEIAKYTHNCFLATKVSFFNELYDACMKSDIEYSKMAQAAALLGGIGEGHLKVPGPDGKRGFGGMCFVKDTEAFASWAKGKQLKLKVLKAAIESNRNIRPSAYDGSENVGVVRKRKTS